MSRQANKRRRGDTELSVYGRRAVTEAIDAPNVAVHEVRVGRDVAAHFRKTLAHTCRNADIPCIEASRNDVADLSHDTRHDQGVAARITLGEVMEPDAFVAALTGERARTPAAVIALDAITNPQNIGMIVRSAVAAGIDGILWPLAGCPWINGLIIKAAASSIYRAPIIRCDTLTDGLLTLQSAGFTTHGLDTTSDATNLFDHNPPHRAVYILGAESTGLTEEAKHLTDAYLAIPMQNNVESLNVATAAALLNYHVTRS